PRGNPIERTFFGTDGMPVLAKDGYAKLRQLYDSRSRVIERVWFDVDDRVLLINDLPARIRYEYDDEDRIARKIYLDENGREIPIDVVVVRVVPGSVAERIGLARDDRIVTYDGKRPVDVDNFVNMTVGTAGTSGMRALVIRRGASLLTFEVP